MYPSSLAYLYRLRKTQWWSPRELERLQWQNLRRVLHHAYERVAYYRRLFDSAGITPADIRSRADLSLIPITTKETLQQAPGYRVRDRHDCPTARYARSAGGVWGVSTKAQTHLAFMMFKSRVDS